jgi:hypothetical protein
METMTKGLVTKPQFDLSIFKLGRAIRVVNNKVMPRYQKFESDCIITGANPLELEVSYYDHKERDMENVRFTVDEVSSGTVVITFLKGEE